MPLFNFTYLKSSLRTISVNNGGSWHLGPPENVQTWLSWQNDFRTLHNANMHAGTGNNLLGRISVRSVENFDLKLRILETKILFPACSELHG
jgi:hypothetical protein